MSKSVNGKVRGKEEKFKSVNGKDQGEERHEKCKRDNTEQLDIMAWVGGYLYRKLLVVHGKEYCGQT